MFYQEIQSQRHWEGRPAVQLFRPSHDRFTVDTLTGNGAGKWNNKYPWYILGNRQLGRKAVKKGIDLWGMKSIMP
jgi:hypothetical protein